MFFQGRRFPGKKKKKNEKGWPLRPETPALQPDFFLFACIPEAAFCRGEVAAVFEVAVKTKTKGGRECFRYKNVTVLKYTLYQTKIIQRKTQLLLLSPAF